MIRNTILNSSIITKMKIIVQDQQQQQGRGSKTHPFSIKIKWISIDFVSVQPRDGLGTILPSTGVRGVAWATRIDNEGQTV